MRPTQLLIAVTLLAALTAPAESRDRYQTAPQTPPTIEIYSRETIVDVLVTDAKGRPVRGLTRSDFTVKEDDNPQPIRGFQEFSKDLSTDSPSPPLPPNTYTNAHTQPASGPVTILVLDLTTTSKTNMLRAKPPLAEYLRSMPPGTQVAVFELSRVKGLSLLQGFTTNGPLAASAVDRLDVEWSANPGYASDHTIGDPIAAMDNIAAYVAAVHGRKNVVWVGRPPNIMGDGGYAWADPTVWPVSPIPDMTTVHRLMDTFDRFTEEQIAVYPFDPRGVSPAVLLDIEPLRAQAIAEATGGAAIFNNNDFKSAVAKIIDDTSNYYTLTYSPPHPDDDHYHPIKIEVDRPGLHLVYRTGYNSERPADPDPVLKAHMTQDSMDLGALLSTQILFAVHAEPSAAPTAPSHASVSSNPLTPSGPSALPILGLLNPKLKNQPLTRYGFLYSLPASQITFTDAPNQVHKGSLKLGINAYDPEGRLVTSLIQTVTMPLSDARYRQFIQGPFRFLQQLDLPPGQFILRIGVLDGVSTKAGTLEVPLTVPKPTSPTLASAPPK